MAYWLVKSEPSVYSIDDLRRDGQTLWEGVRNYQARNFLQAMRRGDLVLFYHSGSEPPGVAGIGKVVQEAYPDPTQFDRRSPYFDEGATKVKPRWFCPDIAFVEIFKHFVSLDDVRELPEATDLPLLKRGNRLSVMPVSDVAFKAIRVAGEGR